MPGFTELVVVLILLVLPLAVAFWVSQDAKKRGSKHHLAWGAMTFVSVLGYGVLVVLFVVFYLIVRDDIGDV